MRSFFHARARMAAHVFAWGGLTLPLAAQTSLPLYPEALFPELRPALQHAMDASTTLTSLELRETVAHAEADQAAAVTKPRVQLFARTAGAYITRDDIDAEWRGSLNANLTVSQPVFHWGALEKTVELGALRADIAEARASTDRKRHLAYARDLYLRWRRAYEREQVLTQSLALSKQFLAAQQALRDAGQRSDNDVLNLELRVLEQEERLTLNTLELSGAAQLFTRATGHAPPEPAGEASLAALPGSEALATWAEGLRQQITETESVKATRLQQTVLAKEREIIAVQQRPKIDLVAGVFGDQLDAVDSTDSVLRVQYFAGLQVNWNLFDGGRTEAQLISARARERLEAAREAEVIAQLETELDRQLNELALRLAQIETRETRVDLLSRRVALLEAQVDRNRAAPLTLLEARLEREELQRQVLEARFDYLRTLAYLNASFLPDPILLPVGL